MITDRTLIRLEPTSTSSSLSLRSRNFCRATLRPADWSAGPASSTCKGSWRCVRLCLFAASLPIVAAAKRVLFLESKEKKVCGCSGGWDPLSTPAPAQICTLQSRVENRVSEPEKEIALSALRADPIHILYAGRHTGIASLCGYSNFYILYPLCLIPTTVLDLKAIVTHAYNWSHSSSHNSEQGV